MEFTRAELIAIRTLIEQSTEDSESVDIDLNSAYGKIIEEVEE